MPIEPYEVAAGDNFYVIADKVAPDADRDVAAEYLWRAAGKPSVIYEDQVVHYNPDAVELAPVRAPVEEPPPTEEPPVEEPPTSTDRIVWTDHTVNDAWDGRVGYLLTPHWDKVPLIHPQTGVALPLTAALVGVQTSLGAPESGIDVNTNGAVIEGRDFTGSLTVEADDVTIRNCRVTASGSVPLIRSNGARLLIEHCELRGDGNNPPGCVAYGNYTLRRSIVTGARDCLKVSANTLIEHNLIVLPCKEGTSHSDAIQGSGGSNIVIRHNVIAGPYQRATSAIKLTGEQNDMGNVTIEGNYLSGGSLTLYTTSSEGHSTSGFEVHDNLIEADAWMYGPRKNTASNVNETGTTVYKP